MGPVLKRAKVRFQPPLILFSIICCVWNLLGVRGLRKNGITTYYPKGASLESSFEKWLCPVCSSPRQRWGHHEVAIVAAVVVGLIRKKTLYRPKNNFENEIQNLPLRWNYVSTGHLAGLNPTKRALGINQESFNLNLKVCLGALIKPFRANAT